MGLKKNKKNSKDVEPQFTGDVFDRVFQDLDNRQRMERDAALKTLSEQQAASMSQTQQVAQPVPTAVQKPQGSQPVPMAPQMPIDTQVAPTVIDYGEGIQQNTKMLHGNAPVAASEAMFSTTNISSGIVSFGSSSVIGKRKSQQDAIGVTDNSDPKKKKYIAVLCDGMGGMQGGEKASALCIEKMMMSFQNETNNIPEFITGSIIEIDDAVASLKDENGNPLGAGSTFISVIVDEYKVYWGSVGDSHLYIIRGNEMILANTEHNYYQDLLERVKLGEITQQEADTDPSKEALTSYMGIGGITLMDVTQQPFTALSGDYMVLCSDGLYRALSDGEIHNIVKQTGADPQRTATTLTETAIAKNMPYQDNTSVIVIKFN